MSVKEKFLDYVSYDTQSDSSSTTMSHRRFESGG